MAVLLCSGWYERFNHSLNMAFITWPTIGLLSLGSAFLWPVTVKVEQYTAILHYINLPTKVEESVISYILVNAIRCGLAAF